MDVEGYTDQVSALVEEMERSGENREFYYPFANVTTGDEIRATLLYKYLDKYNIMPFQEGPRIKYRKSQDLSIELRACGNRSFMKNNEKALKHYTQSIGLAPYPKSEEDDSEVLALGFANRSAVYFVQKKYEACLKDIENALTFKYPDALRYKLVERRAKCYLNMGNKEEARASAQHALELLPLAIHLTEDKRQGAARILEKMKTDVDTAAAEGDAFETSDNVRPLPKLTKEANKNVPSASAIVDIKYTPELGRHVAATTCILPAEVMFVEDPYSSVVFPGRWLTHCNNCFKKCDAMIPCTVCHCVMYCSAGCRSTAWTMFHSVECQLAPVLAAHHTSMCSLLPLRTLLIACYQHGGLAGLYRFIKTLENEPQDEELKGFDENGKYTSSDYRQIHHLVKHIGTYFHEQVLDAMTTAYIMNGLEVYTDFFYNDGKIQEPEEFSGGAYSECSTSQAAGDTMDIQKPKEFSGGADSKCSTSQAAGDTMDIQKPKEFSGGADSECSTSQAAGDTMDIQKPKRFTGGEDSKCSTSQAAGDTMDIQKPKEFSGGADSECSTSQAAGDTMDIENPKEFSGGADSACSTSQAAGDTMDIENPKEFSGGADSACSTSQAAGDTMDIQKPKEFSGWEDSKCSTSQAAEETMDIQKPKEFSGGENSKCSTSQAAGDTVDIEEPERFTGGGDSACSTSQAAGDTMGIQKPKEFSGGVDSACSTSQAAGDTMDIQKPKEFSGGADSACSTSQAAGDTMDIQKPKGFIGGEDSKCSTSQAAGDAMNIEKPKEFSGGADSACSTSQAAGDTMGIQKPEEFSGGEDSACSTSQAAGDTMGIQKPKEFSGGVDSACSTSQAAGDTMDIQKPKEFSGGADSACSTSQAAGDTMAIEEPEEFSGGEDSACSTSQAAGDTMAIEEPEEFSGGEDSACSTSQAAGDTMDIEEPEEFSGGEDSACSTSQAAGDTMGIQKPKEFSGGEDSKCSTSQAAGDAMDIQKPKEFSGGVDSACSTFQAAGDAMAIEEPEEFSGGEDSECSSSQAAGDTMDIQKPKGFTGGEDSACSTFQAAGDAMDIQKPKGFTGGEDSACSTSQAAGDAMAIEEPEEFSGGEDSECSSSQAAADTVDIEELRRFTGGLLLKLIEIVNVNAFSVTELVIKETFEESSQELVGIALYSALSVLDHSCNPNAIAIYHNGHAQVIRARRPIKKGEIITIAYGRDYSRESMKVRQELNATKYCFQCDCEACVNAWPTFDDLPGPEDAVLICRHCRIPLPLPVTVEQVYAVCPPCGRQYNLLQMEVDTLRMRCRMEEIMSQLAAGHKKDFTSELATYSWILDNTVQNPNQLIVSCQDHLLNCLSFYGNVVKE